jgi:hypothetical protein
MEAYLLNLQEIRARPVYRSEEPLFQKEMQAYHYLGSLPKIGNSIWYIATYQENWLALLTFSAAALKCRSRDNWIGWNYRYQYDRLNLIANNSRFLILPGNHHKNMASKILSLCRKRIQKDWIERFGYPLLLLETFVDPTRFNGTIYKAANWVFTGYTKGYQRIRAGYSNTVKTPKMVFVQPVQRSARTLLSCPKLNTRYQTGAPRMKLRAEHMKSLPYFFKGITDPRRAQARQHRIEVVLAMAAGAVLCGMCGYKAIADWVKSLSPKARLRFGCRRKNKKYLVPSEGTIRRVLMKVDPTELDQSLQKWNETHGATDEALAIDGKTMCNAIDEQGRQTHIMSAIGHQSGQCYTQKKWAPCQ